MSGVGTPYIALHETYTLLYNALFAPMIAMPQLLLNGFTAVSSAVANVPMLANVPVLAQLLNDGSVGSGTTWEGGGGLSVVMVLLILMAGCISAFYILIKRGGLPRTKGGGHLELLETRMLGGRQYLVVAKHGQQKFLLGVCPGRIDYLCPLEDGGHTEHFDEAAADFARTLDNSRKEPTES